MSTSSYQINPAPNEPFTQLGERLCLDFVNTKEHRLYRSPDDLLTGNPALLAWAVYSGIMTDEERWVLLQRVQDDAEKASRIFERAVAFREVLHRVFCRIAHADAPTDADLNQIKQMYVQAIAHTEFSLTANSFTLLPGKENLTAEHILWDIARSAVEVLTTADLTRIKECPGINDCGYLFLDISKNGTRHWCSMDICGSRVKMRRQYARKRRMRE